MKFFSNNPILYIWKKMYFYAGERRKQIQTATTLFVFAHITDAMQPIIFGVFLNFIQKNGITRENLFHLFLILLLFLGSEIIFWVLHGPARIIEQENAFFIKKNYKEYLLGGVFNLPLSWHVDHHSGDTIDKIEKGTSSLFSFSENTFQYIQAFIRFITSLGALIYFDLPAALIATVVSIIIFYIISLYDKKLVPGYKIVNRLENTSSSKLYDSISNITTIIILRVENLVFKTISYAIDSPLVQFKKNALNNELKWTFGAVLGQLSVITTIGIYMYSNVQRGEVILVGSMYILYSYASKVRETFFSFAYLYNNVVKYRTAISNSEELSNDFIKNSLLKNNQLPKDWNTLLISNLSFSYHDHDNADLHLENVTISLKKGEKIAVIGESGGGKTTFLKLFRGLYIPKTMTIKIDEKDPLDDFNSISESISLIPQDPEIFSTTILENITLGVEYTDTEIRSITDMSSFTDVISRLPNGLDSSVVEKGVNLSGGEKQRLALARGLLASRDKDIILLDEPTSSVDFHNELSIYKNIFESFPDKTIISSIHRLHLLSLFDTIIFFKQGKIIATGNLDYLKEHSKDFQRLWAKYIKTQDQ